MLSVSIGCWTGCDHTCGSELWIFWGMAQHWLPEDFIQDKSSVVSQIKSLWLLVPSAVLLWSWPQSPCIHNLVFWNCKLFIPLEFSELWVRQTTFFMWHDPSKNLVTNTYWTDIHSSKKREYTTSPTFKFKCILQLNAFRRFLSYLQHVIFILSNDWWREQRAGRTLSGNQPWICVDFSWSNKFRIVSLISGTERADLKNGFQQLHFKHWHTGDEKQQRRYGGER